MEGVDRGETDKIEGSKERECRKKQFEKVDSKKKVRGRIEQIAVFWKGAERRREGTKKGV